MCGTGQVDLTVGGGPKCNSYNKLKCNLGNFELSHYAAYIHLLASRMIPRHLHISIVRLKSLKL